MRQSPSDLDFALQTYAYTQKRDKEFETMFTPERADRLGKAVNGSHYTNPEITAAIGLSEIPIDAQAVNQHTAQQALLNRQANLDTQNLTRSEKMAAAYTPPSAHSLQELLSMPSAEYRNYGRTNSLPDWFEEVDPGSEWRNIDVPEIKTGKEVLNLTEDQAIKLYLTKGLDGFNQLFDNNLMGANSYQEVNGKMLRVPGSWAPLDDVSKKFPIVGKMWQSQLDKTRQSQPKNKLLPGLLEDLQPLTGPLATALNTVGQVGGALLPDVFEPIAAGARGAVRAGVTGFVALAQFGKANVEYQLTQGGTSMLGIDARAQMNKKEYEDYKNLVVEGNVLTQIIKQGKNPEQNISLGSGFFPSGTAMEEARKARDAALPKISGQSWTVGRAIVEPLIQHQLIDRDGFAADIISGLADGTFTLATDASLYFDPVRVAMKAFNLGDEAASALLTGQRLRKLNKLDPNWVDKPGFIETTGTLVGTKDVPDFADFQKTLDIKLPPELEQAIDKNIADGLAAAGVDVPAVPTPGFIPENMTLLPFESTETITARRQKFGIVDGAENSPARLNPMAIDEMPYTKDGTRALGKLASFNNVGELYNFFGGKIPIGLSAKIQASVDAAKLAGKPVDLNEIHTILRDGVFSGDPLYNVREVPGIIKGWTNETGRKVAYYAAKKTRQLATMPGSTFFQFDDPISSINDMNKFMIVLKIPEADRNAMLSKAIDAVVNHGAGKRFELANDWMKTTLGPALRKNGVSEDWIKAATTWGKDVQEIHQLTMDAVGQGYHLPWLEDGAKDILRSVDAFNQGFLMINPDNLKQAIQETTNLFRALKPFRANPSFEKSLENFNDLNQALEHIQKNWLKPIALGAPLPYRMLTKILPDEILRIIQSGNFSTESLKMLGVGGHVNYTTHGTLIKTGKEIVETMANLDYLGVLRGELKLAEFRLARGAETQEFVDLLKAKVTKYEKKWGTEKELRQQVKVLEQRQDTDLPGANRKLAKQVTGLGHDAEVDPNYLQWRKSRKMNQVVRKEVENPITGNRVYILDDEGSRNWITGTAEDIGKMSSAFEYNLVAAAMLKGGTGEIRQLVSEFYNGSLRPEFEKYVKSLSRQNPDRPLDSPAGIEDWISTIQADIMTRTFGDKVLIGAIATGELGHVPIIVRHPYNAYEVTKELKAFVKENLFNKPTFDTNGKPFNQPAPYFSKEVSTQTKKIDRLLTKQFSLYRNASAKFARNPLMDYTKWKRIRELIPGMDPKEARLMVDALEKSDAPKWLREDLKERLPLAQGTATRKQVELLGDMQGNQVMTDLLFDHTKHYYFGSRHSLLFGFFDAWFEQLSVWGRAIAEQPTILEKARLAQEGLQDTEVPSILGGQPGQGILYKDPNTGQQAVALPLSSTLYSHLGLNAEEVINTKGLTMLGTAVPGLFGVGAFIFSATPSNTEISRSIRNVMFPYGSPTAKGNIANYFLPAWATGLIAAGVNKTVKGTNFAEQINTLTGTEQNDSLRATTLLAVLTNIISNSNKVPTTSEERAKLIEDALAKTDYLLAIKNTLKIFSPAATMTKYYTETNQENVATGNVMDDLRNITQASIDDGKTYAEGVSAFLDKYGQDAWIFLSGSSLASPGMQPTKEFAQWMRSNSSIVTKYPNVGSYLGPQEGEYSPSAFSEQRNMGLRPVKDIKTKQNDSLNNYAWSVHNQLSIQLIKSGIEQGLTKQKTKNEQDYIDKMKAQDDYLKNLFPLWDPSSINKDVENAQYEEIRQMIKDKKVLSTPVGKSLKAYWDYRTKLVTFLTKKLPKYANNAWRDSTKTAGLRKMLTIEGDRLAKENPDFMTLWENVLSREYTTVETEVQK